MHIVGDPFLNEIKAKNIPAINLHPALPGAFDGANAIERAYDAFKRGEITHGGVMVHRVIKDVDKGEPIIVREVPINTTDTLETFAERLHQMEWRIIVEATAIVLDEVKPAAQTSR